MSDKELLRKDQIAYLDEVILIYDMDLTNIARAAGVSSTTLTRFYNNPNVKHCLSSTTLEKIKKKLPIKKKPEEAPQTKIGANDNRADAELAITFAFQLLIQAILNKDYANKDWLTENFMKGESHFRKHLLPNAAHMMNELVGYITAESLQKGKGRIRQSSELLPSALRQK